MAFAGRMKDLFKKYGKVAIGVHLSVSAVSITGLYVAIKNNVDVDSLFKRFGLSSVPKENGSDTSGEDQAAKRNRTADLVASSGGALAMAILCNKALFPVRVPVTIALTPPIARFLAKRKLLRTGL